MNPDMLTPPGKKRRTDRQPSPDSNTPAPNAEDETITNLLTAADSPFTAANLDAQWPNAPNTTWNARIIYAVKEWAKMWKNQPNVRIHKNKPLRKKFQHDRTEEAVKNGMVSHLVCKTVHGPQVGSVDLDTHSGGLLKNCSGTPEHTDCIVPLVKFIVKNCNIESPQGDLLKVADILDKNFGNWRKNLIGRSKPHGAWSDAAVLAIVARGFDDSSAVDEACCKGICLPWCEWLIQNFPDFHRDTVAASPLHCLVPAQGTAAAWDTRVAATNFKIV